jgi:predicted nucleic acid-binding protein
MKIDIYLDTTIISALFDDRTPERKIHTEIFWDKLSEYNVHISDLVIDEINGASDTLRNKMLNKIQGFNKLSVRENAETLAGIYVENGIFPMKYFDDALHVAIASINKIGILASWNFTHLVKVKTRRMIALINAIQNFNSVEIVSPLEL